MATRRRKQYHEDFKPEFREQIWLREFIEPWELLRIATWKSAMAAASVSVEDPERIKSVTRAVLEFLKPYRHASAAEVLCGSEAEREGFREATRLAIGFGPKGEQGSGLCSLHGVGVPVATAVLTTLNPSAWPVVDRWAVHTLFLAPSPPADAMEVYWPYLERLAALQRGQYADKTIHEVDLLAMDLGMRGEDPPFDRVAFVTSVASGT